MILHFRAILYRGGPLYFNAGPSLLWGWSGITPAAAPVVTLFDGISTSMNLTGVGH
jgi:hypothetical protein